MKRLFVIITLTLLAIATKAQIRTCAYYDGYWGKWKDQWLPSLFSSSPEKFYYDLYGNESGFIVYNKGDHPSDYVFKFQINNYVKPSKQQIKDHYKRNDWYEYNGTVEYFVVESAPTIKEILKKWGFPIYHDWSTRNEPIAKRVANATIKIAPYKKHPELYNIWFDDVAIGIQLVYIHFAN